MSDTPETEPEYRKPGEILSERIQAGMGRLAVRCTSVVLGAYSLSMCTEALAAQAGDGRYIHLGVSALYGILAYRAWQYAKTIRPGN